MMYKNGRRKKENKFKKREDKGEKKREKIKDNEEKMEKMKEKERKEKKGEKTFQDRKRLHRVHLIVRIYCFLVLKANERKFKKIYENEKK